MAALFSPEFAWMWAVALAAALWYPVRQLVWVLSVRRAVAKGLASDETARERLKRRANVTSALLCFVFAMLYSNYLFRPGP